MPEEVLNDMGLDLAEIDYAPIERAQVDRTEVDSNIGIDIANLETVDITVIRRGVIGVNKVGYVV